MWVIIPSERFLQIALVMTQKTNRQVYLEKGFVSLPGFFDAREIAICLEKIREFIETLVPKLPRDHVFYEAREELSTLKQIQQMQHHCPWCNEFMNGRPRALAEELMGKGVVARNMQYFNKPPLAGRPTPPHQDGYYFKLNPPEALTMWLALDEVNEENGCIRYVAGSHRDGLRAHGPTGTLGFSQGMTDFGRPGDLSREEVMQASPGDLLVHDSMTIHRAEGNTSGTRNRRALGFIFYSEDALEDERAKEEYRREAQRQQQGRI